MHSDEHDNDRTGERPEPQPKREATRQEVLTACVKRMKASGLTGKARDDAAHHFLAGWAAGQGKTCFEPTGGYLAVLEALAD